MLYQRMPIEAESPEERGYSTIKYNLAESSVRDLSLKQLDIIPEDLLLSYGVHRGDDALRAAVVEGDSNLNASHVLITPGAAGALFFIATSLLQKEDHLIVLRPNYATNIETPKAIGCEITYIDLQLDLGYQLDLAQIERAIQPNTKLISITTPHNPTGIIYSQEEITQLITIAKNAGANLLVDETYRDLLLNSTAPAYAAGMNDCVISVASLSKAYGVPGIRIGWIICKDMHLMEKFLAAKEQIIICGSILDEAVALQIFKKREQILQFQLDWARKNKIIFDAFMQTSKFLEWNAPQGGVVAFVKIKDKISLNLAAFYEKLTEEYSTVVGCGHWFEQDDRYMRIGFGYPGEEEFKQGLMNIERAIEDVMDSE